jgi:hypothetical protein
MQTIPPDVARAITDAELAVFWMQRGGAHLSYVDLEAGFARNACPETPLLVFVDEGIRPEGCLEWRDAIYFSVLDPWQAIQKSWQVAGRNYAALGRDVAPRLAGWLLTAIGLRLVQALPAHEKAGARR